MNLISELIYIIALVSMIWVIYDVWAVNKKLSIEIKITWTIVAIFFSIITAIIYYFVEKNK